MMLALTAKVSLDPKRVLEDRWVHDTTHALAESILKARRAARGRDKARK